MAADINNHDHGDEEFDDCGSFFDKAEDPEPCKCQSIVLKTFDSLTSKGMSKGEAIKVATNVLKYHHPCPTSTANTIVECWVHKHTHDSVH